MPKRRRGKKSPNVGIKKIVVISVLIHIFIIAPFLVAFLIVSKEMREGANKKEEVRYIVPLFEKGTAQETEKPFSVENDNTLAGALGLSQTIKPKNTDSTAKKETTKSTETSSSETTAKVEDADIGLKERIEKIQEDITKTVDNVVNNNNNKTKDNDKNNETSEPVENNAATETGSTKTNEQPTDGKTAEEKLAEYLNTGSDEDGLFGSEDGKVDSAGTESTADNTTGNSAGNNVNSDVSDNVVGRLISSAKPSYPSELLGKGVFGTVVVKITVGPDGSVYNPIPVKSSGYAAFDKSAVDAVRKYKFRPGDRQEGKVTIKFSPNKK